MKEVRILVKNKCGKVVVGVRVFLFEVVCRGWVVIFGFLECSVNGDFLRVVVECFS